MEGSGSTECRGSLRTASGINLPPRARGGGRLALTGCTTFSDSEVLTESVLLNYSPELNNGS